MSEILDTAKQLGESIGKSDEYHDMQNCQKLLKKDTAASNLLKEYADEREKITSYKNLGIPVPPNKFKKYEDLQEQMRSNQVIIKLLDAQKNYETLLKNVNNEINNTIEKS